MEDLIGILVFLAFAVLSAMSKAERKPARQRTRRQPSRPPTVHRPAQAPAPRAGRSSPAHTGAEQSLRKSQMQSEASPVPSRLRPQQPLTHPTAGQQLGGAIRAERERFARETGAFVDSPEQPGTDMEAPAAAPHPLAAVLASRDGLGQAMLLAEVLGKPKALRRSR